MPMAPTGPDSTAQAEGLGNGCLDFSSRPNGPRLELQSDGGYPLLTDTDVVGFNPPYLLCVFA
jgi:hypothetical protein